MKACCGSKGKVTIIKMTVKYYFRMNSNKHLVIFVSLNIVNIVIFIEFAPFFMSITANKTSSIISESVLSAETSSDTFSANYVIHAYQQGHKKGMHDKIIELETDAKSQFINNRDFTISTINSLINDFIKDGVITPRGWIKSEGTDEFDVILAIPQEKYLSDTFDQYYIKANELENKSNNPDFHLNIRFINASKRINEEKLFCDGYKLKFELVASPKS